MKTPDPTLITALNVLERDIQSEDGVANACIAEAAERLRELSERNAELTKALEFVAVAVIPDPNALVLNYAWLADRLAEARPKGGYGLSAFDLILKAAKAHAK